MMEGNVKRVLLAALLKLASVDFALAANAINANEDEAAIKWLKQAVAELTQTHNLIKEMLLPQEG